MRAFARIVCVGMALALMASLCASAVAGAPRREGSEVDEYPLVEPAALTPTAEYAEDEVLVRPKIESHAPKARVAAVCETIDSLTRGLGARTLEVITLPNGVPVHRVKLDRARGLSVEAAIERYESDPSVEYAEPNWKRHAYEGEPPVDDPLFGFMWGLHNVGQEIIPRSGLSGVPDADIDAPEAWEAFEGDEPVVVAVIDTGIQYYHPDLRDSMWTNPGEIPDNGEDDDENGFVDDVYGWDFFWNDNTVYDVADEEGHGTHTSGTVAATGNNAVGVVGVAWKANVKIMALKFLGPDGGYDADAIKAFSYAALMGATLTSNSWGGGGYGRALREAIEASGMLAICAAGNSASDNDVMPHYPSSYVSENVIAVAASEWNDDMASFSCWGAQSVDIAAPGHWVLSTYPARNWVESSYAWAGGTSMATPHVAGVAALLAAMHPEAPQYEGDEGWSAGTVTVKDMILNSSDVRPAFVGKVLTGGRLNADNALAGIWPPAIYAVHADRTYGAPGDTGLTVTFSGTAGTRRGMRGASQIVDQWWDFGDDSEPVHAATAIHTYTEEGCYTATFHVLDEAGSEAIASVPVVVVNPDTVVFVDDDEGAAYDASFEAAFEAAGRPYVTIGPSSIAALPLDMPNPVVWNCGEAYSGTLLESDREYLSRYLDTGGRLFLSGYDILYDLVYEGNDPDFVEQYLHVDAGLTGVSLQDYSWRDGVLGVTGRAGDPISAGMDIDLEYPGTYDPTYVDGMAPIGGACAVFDGPPAPEGGDPIPVGVRYADSVSRVVFLGFPFEAVPLEDAEPNNSAVLIERILQFLTDESPGANLLPAVIDASADVQVGVAPLEVAFSGQATDAEGPVDVEWDFGDGSPAAPAAVATHLYAQPGVYTATFAATDGDGAQASRSLTIIVTPSADTVLLVDGDPLGLTPEYLEPAMVEAGIPYVVVQPGELVAAGGMAPGTEQFLLLWNCGLVGFPNQDEVSGLKGHLADGGRLLIIGQELIYGAGMNFANPDDFVIRYLHVMEANSDVRSEPGDVFSGVEGDPITDGLSFEVDFAAAGIDPGLDWIDEVQPDSDAAGIITAPDGTCRALRYGGDDYKVVFIAFPIEVVPSGAEGVGPGSALRADGGTLSPAATLLSRACDWLGNEPPVVAADGIAPRLLRVGGTPVDITWTATDGDDVDSELVVSLECSMDDGATWATIADGEPNDGTFAWDGAGVTRGGEAIVRVTATDPHGATGSDTSDDTVTVIAAPGMLVAGPNPASERVTFYYSMDEPGMLRVFDIAGRQVYSADVAAGDGSVVWSLVDGAGRRLANGLYVAILVTDGGSMSEPLRLIIRR